MESVHQSRELHQVDRGHSFTTAALLLLPLSLLLGHSGGLARVVCPQGDKEFVRAMRLEDLHHGVIDRVLVLLEPTSDVVRHNTSIVRDGKVSVLVSL